MEKVGWPEMSEADKMDEAEYRLADQNMMEGETELENAISICQSNGLMVLRAETVMDLHRQIREQNERVDDIIMQFGSIFRGDR